MARTLLSLTAALLSGIVLSAVYVAGCGETYVDRLEEPPDGSPFDAIADASRDTAASDAAVCVVPEIPPDGAGSCGQGLAGTRTDSDSAIVFAPLATEVTVVTSNYVYFATSNHLVRLPLSRFASGASSFVACEPQSQIVFDFAGNDPATVLAEMVRYQSDGVCMRLINSAPALPAGIYCSASGSGPYAITKLMDGSASPTATAMGAFGGTVYAAASTQFAPATSGGEGFFALTNDLGTVVPNSYLTDDTSGYYARCSGPIVDVRKLTPTLNGLLAINTSKNGCAGFGTTQFIPNSKLRQGYRFGFATSTDPASVQDVAFLHASNGSIEPSGPPSLHTGIVALKLDSGRLAFAYVFGRQGTVPDPEFNPLWESPFGVISSLASFPGAAKPSVAFTRVSASSTLIQLYPTVATPRPAGDWQPQDWAATGPSSATVVKSRAFAPGTKHALLVEGENLFLSVVGGGVKNCSGYIARVPRSF